MLVTYNYVHLSARSRTNDWRPYRSLTPYTTNANDDPNSRKWNVNFAHTIQYTIL